MKHKISDPRQELREKMEQIFAEELSIREAKGGTIRYETVNPGIQGREAFKQRCLHLIDEYTNSEVQQVIELIPDRRPYGAVKKMIKKYVSRRAGIEP